MSASSADYSLDTRGLWCPEPLIIVRNKVREMQDGETIYILATDPSTHRDFTNFCRFMKHTLVESAATDEEFSYVIKKGL